MENYKLELLDYSSEIQKGLILILSRETIYCLKMHLINDTNCLIVSDAYGWLYIYEFVMGNNLNLVIDKKIKKIETSAPAICFSHDFGNRS